MTSARLDCKNKFDSRLYMPTYGHIYIHINTYIYIYAYIHTEIYMYLYICVCIMVYQRHFAIFFLTGLVSVEYQRMLWIPVLRADRSMAIMSAVDNSIDVFGQFTGRIWKRISLGNVHFMWHVLLIVVESYKLYSKPGVGRDYITLHSWIKNSNGRIVGMI